LRAAYRHFHEKYYIIDFFNARIENFHFAKLLHCGGGGGASDTHLVVDEGSGAAGHLYGTAGPEEISQFVPYTEFSITSERPQQRVDDELLGVCLYRFRLGE
jgi:hypothetical protein